RLYLADVLAGAAGGLLSSSEQSAVILGSNPGDCVTHCSHRNGASPAEKTPLYPRWLVLVPGDACAGHWRRSGRRASACRPLYLPASHWSVLADRLGCY